MTNVNKNSRPNLNILKQYIKDLSYENPLSLDSIQSQQNLNNVSVDMNALFHPYKKDVYGNIDIIKYYEKKIFKEISNIDLNTIDYEKHKEFIKEIPDSIWNKIEG